MDIFANTELKTLRTIYREHTAV